MKNQLILATTMGSFSQLLESISCNSSNHFIAIASDKLAISSLQIRNPTKFKALPEDSYFESFKNESDETIFFKAKLLEQALDTTLAQLISYDRRFCSGKNVKFVQSYSPYRSYSYSVRYILSISSLIDECIQHHTPTICINFGSSNIADILLELYARHYGIIFRQIKSAKVANYLNHFPSGLNYSFLNQKSFHDDDIKIASRYIENSSKSKVKYEGSIQISPTPALTSIFIKALFKLPRAFASSLKYQCSSLKDHHFISPISYWYFSYISQPCKWILAKNRHSFNALATLNAKKKNFYYILFPLHHEPEVSIQVYGNESLNQIETIRKLSLSTPHDVLILVKEHPRSIGFRSNSFYSKLNEIPKVVLVDPYVSSTSILSITDMTAVISSSIAIESACKQIPVLHFGDIFLQGISNDMIHKVTSIESIRQAFFHLRYNYKFDYNCLLICIAKYINGSRPVNLYSSLLSKTGREAYEGDSEQCLRNLQFLIEAP